jgi:hypothetical protein
MWRSSGARLIERRGGSRTTASNHAFLARRATLIINEVKAINRVCSAPRERLRRQFPPKRRDLQHWLLKRPKWLRRPQFHHRGLWAAHLKRPAVFVKAGDAAHHIVAGAAPGAAEARATLQGLGIGINDPANGVFLQNAEHASVHTAEYFAEVNRALASAATKAEAERVLQSIAQSLISGTFP